MYLLLYLSVQTHYRNYPQCFVPLPLFLLFLNIHFEYIINYYFFLISGTDLTYYSELSWNPSWFRFCRKQIDFIWCHEILLV